MRIVTFVQNGAVHHGARVGDRIKLYPTALSAVDLAVNGHRHEENGEVLLSEVTLLAPVPQPRKIICIGLNYRAHADEGGNPIPDYPRCSCAGQRRSSVRTPP